MLIFIFITPGLLLTIV